MQPTITWFELPATDFQRAVRFYESVLNTQLKQETGACESPMAFFSYSDTVTGGAVVASDLFKPSAEGAVVYLNAGPDLDGVLSRVTAQGGQIVMEKTLVSEDIGHVALILDSEGNRVGLHMPPG